MSRAKPAQTLANEPNLDARIISTIGSVGPRNVAQIARMTGAHQETIRYKIKRQLVNKGFRFQADVDYRKMGLVLHWGRFVVSQPHNGSATKFFRSLNNFAYLIHYSRILPQGYFVALFALPEGKTTEFAQFLESLRRHKIISEFGLDRVSAQRHKGMDPTFFDFRKDAWDVDWDKTKRLKAAPLTADAGRAEILTDKMDLLIIKELQKDARQHLVGIGRKLRIPTKTLEYHIRTHVADREMITGYRVRWMKDTNEPLSRTTATIRMMFKDLDGNRYKSVQTAMNRLPYLWVEDLLESGTYIATLAVPLIDFTPTLSYVAEELQPLGNQVDIGYLDTKESYNYTIPYQMFSAGRWRFDTKEMESAVLRGLDAGVTK